MITKFGKRFLTNYLAGNLPFDSKDFVLGVGATTATENDTRLNFEFFRFPVEFGSIDIQKNETLSPITGRDGISIIDPGDTLYSVIYKSTIPQEVAGVIKEIGVYPSTGFSSNRFTGKMVALFEDSDNWVEVGGNSTPTLFNSTSTYTARVGDTLLKIDNNGVTTSIEYKAPIVISDFSGYSENDSLTLAYIKADTRLSSIRVKLYSSNSDYYYLDFSSSAGTIAEGVTWAATGYKIHSNTLSNLASSGTPDINNISHIAIVVTCSSAASPATVYLDALRINDEDTFDPLFGMVSRSVLTNPITKISGQQLDIEYRMGLTF